MLGYEQPRLGSGIPYTVPRNTYRTADDRWVALSTSSESVAQRVLRLVGADGDERFATFADRVAHRDEIDRWQARADQERLTIVPLKLYFREGRAKLELGLARGRKTIDKRQAIAQRTADREAAREIARARRQPAD